MALLRFGNDSNQPFSGYLRATVDTLPSPASGTHANGYYVLGTQCGLDTRCVDVYCGLGANGDRRSINTDDATSFSWVLGASPLSGFTVTFAGQAMTFVGEQANGAHWDGEWYTRIGNMLNVRVWVAWYPDDTQYAYVEIAVYCSNPNVTDVFQNIPANFKLVFDTATVMLCGLADNAVVMTEGDFMGDGQTRVVTGLLAYPGTGSGMSAASCRALADQKIQLIGISKAYWCGNPNMPPGPFPPPGWNTVTRLQDATFVLNNWTAGKLDPAYQGHSSGAQGSEWFEQGPAMADPCALGPFYLAGLAHRMPNVHAESDGRLLDPPPAHPQLRLHEGRVNRNFASFWVPNPMDVLGKTLGDPNSEQTHGSSGPSEQHNFDWNLWFAKRAKGTRALEWLISARARITLFQSPIAFPPGNWMSYSRGNGWMLFLCVEMYEELTDRVLAEQVRQHALDFITINLIPQYSGYQSPGEPWWTWHYEDPAGGYFPPGHGAAYVWQACVQALGLKWAGDVFGYAPASAFALEMATVIVNRCLHNIGYWSMLDVVTEDGLPNPLYGWEINHGAFDYFGHAHAVAVVLMVNPSSQPASAFWTQLLEGSGTWEHASTIPPGVNLGVAGISGQLSGTVSIESLTATAVVPIRGSTPDFPEIGVSASLVATGVLPITGFTDDFPGLTVTTTLFSTNTVAGQVAGTVGTTVEATGSRPGSGQMAATVSASVVATGALKISAFTPDFPEIGVSASLVSVGKLLISARTPSPLVVTTTMVSTQKAAGELSRRVDTFISATGARPVEPEPPKPPKPPKPEKPRPRPHHHGWWYTAPLMDLMKWLSRRR